MHYSGAWSVPPNGFACTFTYHPITAHAAAIAEWDLGGSLDTGAYADTIIPLPPKLIYTAAAVQATTYRWRAFLTITG